MNTFKDQSDEGDNLGISERWKRHRPLPADIEKRLESSAPILRKEGVLLADLFGSLAAMDETSPRAPEDVDLAVLTKRGAGMGAVGGAGRCPGHEQIGSGGSEKGLAGAALSKSCAAAGRFMSGIKSRDQSGSWKRCASKETPLP